MATIATISQSIEDDPGGARADTGWAVVDFTFSNSYTAGGEVIPALPGGMVASAISITPKSLVTNVNSMFSHDAVNNKIMAKVGSTGAEVAAATDLSATVLRLVCFGKLP